MGEGDLFKAAEPIILDGMSIDPMTAAILMMSCLEHVMPTTQEGAFQNDQLFGDISYDQCSKKDDVLESDPKDTRVCDIGLAAAAIMRNEMQIEDSLRYMDPGFPKSVSSGCLRSMDWINASAMKPSILEPDFGAAAAYGMRRAFSDGDIKALGNGDTRSLVHPPIQQRPPVAVVGSSTSEDRLQKLSRYRNKKSKRNFGRKIKYACRKALADSQPRIRGRFAKT
ncbi:hypothetical protein V2J09_009059 [Rumex salicifolius]